MVITRARIYVKDKVWKCAFMYAITRARVTMKKIRAEGKTNNGFSTENGRNQKSSCPAEQLSLG